MYWYSPPLKETSNNETNHPRSSFRPQIVNRKPDITKELMNEFRTFLKSSKIKKLLASASQTNSPQAPQFVAKFSPNKSVKFASQTGGLLKRQASACKASEPNIPLAKFSKSNSNDFGAQKLQARPRSSKQLVFVHEGDSKFKLQATLKPKLARKSEQKENYCQKPSFTKTCCHFEDKRGHKFPAALDTNKRMSHTDYFPRYTELLDHFMNNEAKSNLRNTADSLKMKDKVINSHKNIGVRLEKQFSYTRPPSNVEIASFASRDHTGSRISRQKIKPKAKDIDSSFESSESLKRIIKSVDKVYAPKYMIV